MLPLQIAILYGVASALVVEIGGACEVAIGLAG